MTLPASGPISFGQINTEMFRSATASLNLNDVEARWLANRVGAGTIISMSDFYSKTFKLLVFNNSDAFTLRAFTTSVRGNYVQFRADGSIVRNNVVSGTVETNSVLGPTAYITPTGGTNGVGFRVRAVISQLFGRTSTNGAATPDFRFYNVNGAVVSYTSPTTTPYVNVPSTQWIEMSLSSSFLGSVSYAFASGTVQIENIATGATISRAFTLENGANPIPQFDNANDFLLGHGAGYGQQSGIILQNTGNITLLESGNVPDNPDFYTDIRQPNLGSMFESRLVNYYVDLFPGDSALGFVNNVVLSSITKNQLIASTPWVNLSAGSQSWIQINSQGAAITMTGTLQIRKISTGATISRAFGFYSDYYG